MRAQKLKEQIQGYMQRPAELDEAAQPLLFHALLNPAAATKLTLGGIIEEANLLIVAGTDTTSNASALGTVCALAGDGRVARTLQAELRAAWPRLDEKPPLDLTATLHIAP